MLRIGLSLLWKQKEMALRIAAIAIFSLLSLVGCNQNSSMKSNSQPSPEPYAESEAFSLYKRADSKFYVARAVTNGGSDFDLFQYEIETSVPEGAKQSFVSVQKLTRDELENKRAALQTDYNWEPFKGDKVLFIQIDPSGFSNEFELLEKRHDVEEKLGNALERKGLGEWIAGDLGPGGGNMLFTVKDIDRSMRVCLDVLRQNELDQKVRIGRRVRTDKDDWFYEVIHPTTFSGDFNTM